MTAFTGLRAKLYSFTYYDPSSEKLGEKRVAKGIKKSTIKNDLKYSDYEAQILDPNEYMKKNFRSMTCIRSFGHELYTVVTKKAALCSYDTKRYTCADNCHTLAHGHYRTIGNLVSSQIVRNSINSIECY